jgi:hypothetical protein
MDRLDLLHVILNSNGSLLRQRARKMKFTSLRLTALQLDLPVEDETNFIGLDNWADNYAGLSQDIRPRAQVLGGYSAFTGANPNLEAWTGGGYVAGLIGRHALEGEGVYERHRSGDGAFSKEEPSLAGAYGTSFGHWLVGLGGGISHDKDREPSYEDYLDRGQFDGGIGRVYSVGNSSVTWGVSVGFDHDHERWDSTETSLVGPRIGFQGIWQYPQGALGVRLLGQTISGQETWPSAAGRQPSTIYDEKQTRNEAGLRWFHKFQSMPVNIGAEWMFTRFTQDETLVLPRTVNNFQEFTENENGLGVGLAWRITSRALLGAEFQNTRIDSQWSGNGSPTQVYPYDNIRTVSVGTEVPLLAHLVSRLSYKQTVFNVGSSEIMRIHGIGAGAGYAFSDSLKADLAYNRNIQKAPASGTATENAVKLQVSWHF